MPQDPIKLIDIWLILCMLVPFTEVVLITIIEHYREENKKDQDPIEALDNTGKRKTKEEIQTVESGKSCKVAPEPGSSSPTSSISGKVRTDTTSKSDGATTIHVCEIKDMREDEENSACKEKPLKTMFAWVTGWTRRRLTRERKLQVFERIGRA